MHGKAADLLQPVTRGSALWRDVSDVELHACTALESAFEEIGMASASL